MAWPRSMVATMVLLAPVSALADARWDALIGARWPHSVARAAVRCDLGRDKTEAYGLVVLTASPPRSDADVIPVVVTRTAAGEQLHVLEKAVHTKTASVASFTDEFLENGVFTDPQMKCVDPSRDAEVSAKLGRWIQAKGARRGGRHLCYAASAVYNSWVCFDVDPKTKTVVQSFAQFLAD